MAAEVLYPDGVVFSLTNLSGAYTDIDDDADSSGSDADSLSSPAAGSTILRASFPSPSGNLNTGSGLQEFKARLRYVNAGAFATENVTVELYENGVLVSTLSAGTALTSSWATYSWTWDASLLSDVSGADVEIRIQGGQASPPSSSAWSWEISALEWNADYTASGVESTSLPVGGVITAAGYAPTNQIVVTQETTAAYAVIYMDTDFSAGEYSLSGAASVIEAISASSDDAVVAATYSSGFKNRITVGSTEMIKSDLDELRTIVRARFGDDALNQYIYLQDGDGVTLATHSTSATAIGGTGSFADLTITWDMASLDAAGTLIWADLRIGIRFDDPGAEIDQIYNEINWSSLSEGTSLTASADAGALTIAGYDPAYVLELSLDELPVQGTITMAGQVPVASANIELTTLPAQGSITTNEQEAALDARLDLNTAPLGGNLNLLGSVQGYDSRVELGVWPNGAVVVYTGHAPAIDLGGGAAVQPGAGAMSAAGETPALARRVSVATLPVAGSVSASGKTPSFRIIYPWEETGAVGDYVWGDQGASSLTWSAEAVTGGAWSDVSAVSDKWTDTTVSTHTWTTTDEP